MCFPLIILSQHTTQVRFIGPIFQVHYRLQNIDAHYGTTFATRFGDRVETRLSNRGVHLQELDTSNFSDQQMNRYNSLVDLNQFRQDTWANITGVTETS